MLKDVFDKIDSIILNNSNDNIKDVMNEIRIIESKLTIKLPNELKEFYIKYNKNDSMLKSFYIFMNLESLKVEDKFLIIGYSNEYVDKFGIYIDDLNDENIKVRITKYDDRDNWIVYENLSAFIVNCIVFQTINFIQSSAMLNSSEIILEEYFVPLCNIEFTNSRRISYISNNDNILCLHLVNENILYFGANDDEILNNFEEENNIDLDWL